MVATVGTEPTAAELSEYLEARLPGYMVPGSCVGLPSLPVTTTGKCDKHALPAPLVANLLVECKQATKATKAGESGTETRIGRLVSGVMEGRPINRDDKAIASLAAAVDRKLAPK